MKLTKFIPGLTLFTFAALAQADVQVDITGATAFRAATLDAIKNRFVSTNQPFKFAHDQSSSANFNRAGRAIFIGTFPGVSGTTTIRCHFTGSVEGIRALVGAYDPNPPSYYLPSQIASTTPILGGAEVLSLSASLAQNDAAEIALSDVSKASTPYSGSSLQPSNPAVGVVVFTMLANEGSSITNVTSQQFRALLSSGLQPLSLFTGNPDDTSPVFATGRNDASGTRTTYLAEIGFGIAKPVKQYISVASTGSAIQALQIVPEGGTNDSDTGTSGVQLPVGSDIKNFNDTVATIVQSSANASTIWNQNQNGNGGYNSGSGLAADMGKTTASNVTVFDEYGTDAFGEKIKADLVTFLSITDAVTARASNAVICGFNGVRLDGLAGGASSLSLSDKAKITQGVYTAWGFENMYRRNDITSGDVVTVYDALKTTMQTTIATSGIPMAEMAVTRTVDGGTVAP